MSQNNSEGQEQTDASAGQGLPENTEGQNSQVKGGAFGAREEAGVVKRLRPRPRVPCIAAVLGFLVPGLGHVYAGKLRQGALWYVSVTVFPLVLATTGLQFGFRGFLLFLALEMLVAAVVMIDGARVARRQGVVMLASWQRWWVYGVIIVLASVLGVIMQFTVEQKATGIRVFKIPSESMEPGILVGDHIVVDLRAYGNDAPVRGDVVVFRHPKQPDIFFIKRVVAVGGDTVTLRGGRLYVNGELVEEHYIRSDGDASSTEKNSLGPVTVERGKVFVLGDNRAHSHDSRQLGTIDLDALAGKALYIYWSWDAQEHAPRLGRLGMGIR